MIGLFLIACFHWAGCLLQHEQSRCQSIFLLNEHLYYVKFHSMMHLENLAFLKIRVLYKLLLFACVFPEKLLFPGTNGVLLKAVCLWNFLLASTWNGVNEDVEDFFFASSIAKMFSWNLISFSLTNSFKTCSGQ